jgi:tetratricopeptide (TPR) repeat protein
MPRPHARFARLALWATLGLGLLLGARPAAAITVDEIILLCKTGVSADIVIQNIRTSGGRPRVGPADVEKMRAAGVPDKVITYLTGKMSTAGGDQRASDARRSADDARKRDEDRRLEAERLRLEAVRLKREAQRLARDARAARDRAAQLEGRVQEVLRAAFDDLRRGRAWQAITALHAFLGSGLVQPNSFAYLEGSYGLARAFFGVKMYQAASGHLVEVIRRGPTTPRFDNAVSLLQKIVDKLELVHPVIALLAAFEPDVQKRPRAWLDEYHFFLGEFYERYDNAGKALHHFSAVSKQSRRHPAALYHLGLIHTGRKQARTGIRFFRQALRAAQAAKNAPVQDLARQAVARLAFEIGSFGAAAHFYGKIGRKSRVFAQAQYELAWTQVMSEKYRRALGTIHGLRSPFFAREYYPDLLVLEAAAYLNMCRYKEATRTLARFHRRQQSLVKRTRRYLATKPSEARLYKDVRRLASKSPGQALPKAVLYALVADVGFFRTLKTARQLETELHLARTRLAGKVRQVVSADLHKRHRIYLQRVGVEIRRRLRDLLVQQDMVKVKADEIGLEVELAAKAQLEAARRRLQAGGAAARRAKLPRVLSLTLRPGQQVWPFEGEYWLDEIGKFRSRLRRVCPVRKTGKKGASSR